MLKRSLCLIFLAMLGWTAGADQLYIKNKPFNGYLVGTAQNIDNIEVDLGDLCKALGLTVEEAEGNWLVRPSGGARPDLPKGAHKLYFGTKEVPFRTDGDHKLVKLRDAARGLGGRLQRHPELGTIDFDLIPGKTTNGYNPNEFHLVYFGADWAPASKMFKPVVIDYDLKDEIPVIYVDCTQPRSDNYRNFIRYFKGDLIPYTVLIDPKGRAVKTWTGYQDSLPFVNDIRKASGSGR